MEHRRGLPDSKKIPTPKTVHWAKQRIEAKLACADFKRDLSEEMLRAFAGRSKLLRSAAQLRESAFRCHCKLTAAFPKLQEGLGSFESSPYPLQQFQECSVQHLDLLTEALGQWAQQSSRGKPRTHHDLYASSYLPSTVTFTVRTGPQQDCSTTNANERHLPQPAGEGSGMGQHVPPEWCHLPFSDRFIPIHSC